MSQTENRSAGNLWKTGVVYDESMAEAKCLWDDEYNERPERYTHILKRCRELELFKRCEEIPPRDSTESELLKLHTPEMISILKATEDSTDVDSLEKLSSKYDFLYIHPKTFRLSLLAAGSTIELVDNILEGKTKNGMAIVRPPGHHAMKSEYCGYCYFNNVALAAQHAIDNHNLKRILIVDWDIHHGQATQQLFYDDPRVLYFSIHAYMQGTFWPNLRESDYHNIGRGAGLGYNVNIPINQIKMQNGDYMAIFHQLLLPMAHEYQPELIIVSAGYDAALGCPEGEMEITPACYSHLTSSLMGLAGGRVAVVLEGGYCLKSLAEGAALTLRTLLGDPCPLIDPLTAPSQSVRQSILSATYALRKQWKCLQHLGSFSVTETSPASLASNQFWPRIDFLWTEEKPEKYETRGICPAQDPSTFAELDARLDALIQGTSLNVPQYRVSFVSHPSGDHPFTQHCHHLAVKEVSAEEISALGFHGDIPAATSTIATLVDHVISGQSRSGLSLLQAHHSNVDVAVRHALNNRLLQRVLVVDWRSTGARESTRKNLPVDDARLLYVSLRPADDELDREGEADPRGFSVDIAFPRDPCGNVMDCVAAFSRVILPVAYQFNPQLVVVVADDSLPDEKKMNELVGHCIHWLTSLAGGHLVCLFEGSTAADTLSTCVRVLNGDSFADADVQQDQLSDGALGRIRTVMRSLSSWWSALQFDVQLPEENVLVAPWMTDDAAATLQFNPEIKLF